MKKIILVVVGIIMVAGLGRLGWAYWQLNTEKLEINSEATIDISSNVETPIIENWETTALNTTVIPVSSTQTIPTPTTTANKIVASTTSAKISIKTNVKGDTDTSIDLCVGKDGIGTVAPLDQSKVIIDPETGVKVVRDQVLLIFKNETLRSAVDAKINSINGIMVGCLAGMGSYQVAIKGNLTLSDMKVLLSMLNKDPQISTASLNKISSSF